MARDNLELVRKYFDAWGGDAFMPSPDDVDPEIVIDWSESRAPYAGYYTGYEGWRRLTDEIRVSFQDAWLEVHEYYVAGPHIAVRNTAHLRGRDGIEVSASSTIVFTFRDGRVAAARLYQEDADARAAIASDG